VVWFKVQPIFPTAIGTSLTLPKEQQHNRSLYGHVEDARHVALPILATAGIPLAHITFAPAGFFWQDPAEFRKGLDRTW
jgi:hypothetical protein